MISFSGQQAHEQLCWISYVLNLPTQSSQLSTRRLDTYSY